ncbi:MAG: peptide chain release factor N(5)-glutamine methyltransferase [Bacteroidales bacterium]|nr:peptide chain release factor N(5)-glutamine methyltransferase [Bacteroidales bacterium]
MLLPLSNLLSDVEIFIKKQLSPQFTSAEIDHFCQYLFEEFSQITKIERLLKREIYIPESEIIKYGNAVVKLKAETPIQYIVGKTNFFGLDFLVNKSVLIPRPETEELVEWIIDSAKSIDKPSILDIGTGSGCIAICLGKKMSESQVTAVDISKEAIEVARKNAKIHQVNIDFQIADALKTESLPIQKFNIIVSNPPYVRESEKKQMKENVLAYEPHLALFVDDNDPLIFYREIAKYAFNHLEENGQLFFEINEAFAEECKDLMTQIGFTEILIKNDLRGKNRMLKCSL